MMQRHGRPAAGRQRVPVRQALPAG